MSSVNHTECEHECNFKAVTGPVTIAPGASTIYKNYAIYSPIMQESTIENDDGTTTITKATSIIFGGNSDYFRIRFQSTDDAGGSYAEIATADNGNEPIYVRQY